MGGAFDIVDDLSAGVAAEHVPGPKHQQTIREYDIAARRNHADPVAIAVEGQTQFGAGLLHRGDTIRQIGGFGGVGVMVGETAIDLAEQPGDLTAQGLQQSRSQFPGNAVAAVDHHLHGPSQFHIFEDAFEIRLRQVQHPPAARAGSEIRFENPPFQGPDGVAGQGLASQHHFQAVVIRRVVGAGHHHHGIGLLQHRRAEIPHRSRRPAQIDHIHPRLHNPSRQGVHQTGAGQTAIAGNGQGRFPPSPGLGPQGPADQPHRLFGQGLIDDAANVIGAEDAGIDSRSTHRDWGAFAELVNLPCQVILPAMRLSAKQRQSKENMSAYERPLHGAIFAR